MKIIMFPVVLTLMFLVLIATGCTSPQADGVINPGVTTPAEPARCGFTTCHGLDLACGANPPEACTAMYAIGDKCRQFAYCSNTAGTCTLVKTPEFDTCRRCVEQCGGADSAEILLCEEKC